MSGGTGKPRELADLKTNIAFRNWCALHSIELSITTDPHYVRLTHERWRQRYVWFRDTDSVAYVIAELRWDYPWLT